MRHGYRVFVLAGLAAGLGGLSSNAQAQTRTWRTAAPGAFSAGSNWVGGVAPGPGNPASFGLTASTNPFTVTFAAPATTAGLTISNMRPAFDLGGSSLTINGETTVSGTNGPSLTILNGTFNTRQSGSLSFIGRNSGQSGALTVGAGGTWNGVNDIGHAGAGTLSVLAGGHALSAPGDWLVAGALVGSSGVILIDGVGSEVAVPDGSLAIGEGGNGELRVTGGAHAIATSVRAARGGGHGSILVSGAGSLIESTSSDTSIGHDTPGGVGTLTIEDGGTFTHGYFLHAGRGAGTRGDITVRGTGSTLSSPVINLADSGTATLTVEGGARVDCPAELNVSRYNPASQATVTVRGPGSLLTAGSLSTFGGGQATVRVEGGGVLEVLHGGSSWDNGTRRAIVVTGQGSALNFGTDGGMLDFNNGAGSLAVEQHASVSGPWLRLNDSDAATATVTVDGPGSALNLRDFSIDRGAASVSITGGAAARVLSEFRAGCCRTTGPKSLLVRGEGSELIVGDSPNTGGAFLLGYESTGSVGTVDQGARLEVRNNAHVGLRGDATLTVSDPGTSLVTPFELQVGWPDGPSHGSFTLTNGAAATANVLRVNGGADSTGHAVLDGGALMLLGADANVGANASLEVIGGAALELQYGINLSGTEEHPATLRIGEGSYTFGEGVRVGNWDVHSFASLSLEGGAVFGTVELRWNGTLTGHGTLDSTLYHEGLLSPGGDPDGLGTFDVGGNFWMSGSAVTALDIAGAAAFDRVNVAGAITAGGLLELALADGFTPTVGQAFDLLTCPAGRFQGTFQGVAGTDLGGGRALAIQYLPTGVRAVVDDVVGFDITQPSAVLSVGFSVGLSAQALFESFGGRTVTASAAWSSDDPTIATVSPDGRVTAVAPGDTTIRASYAGRSDSLPVSVSALPIPGGVAPGLNAEYRRFWWPRFDDIAPVLTETRPTASIPPGDWNVYGSLTVGDTYVGGLLTGTLNIPTPGDYELTSNDGCGDARVFINGELLIYPTDALWYLSTWSNTVTLPAGPALLRVEFSKRGNYCGYGHTLRWRGPGMSQPEEIPAAAFPPPGLQMEYFLPPTPTLPSEIASYDRNLYPTFATGLTPTLDFPLNDFPGFCARFYGDTGARYTGWLAAPVTGQYTLWAPAFGVRARILVNGEAAGVADGSPMTVTLTQGLNALDVDGFQPGFAYDEAFRLDIAGPGIARQPVPPSALWHGTPAPSCPADFNGDGFLDFFDYDDYVFCFESGTCPPGTTADFNGDGFADFFDYDDFVAAFEVGC